ncbi:MAG: hypothetical protein ACRCTJ_06905 [Brevinema sp.]
MKKTLLLSIYMLINSCGIETPQGLPKLFTPNGVVILEGSKSSQNLTICWYGLNPENEFSGYNIYYAKTKNDALNLRGRKLPNISGGNTQDPSIIVNFPFFEARKFSFLFERNKYNSVIQDDLRGSPVFIWITAFSKTRQIESEASRFAEGQFN